LLAKNRPRDGASQAEYFPMRWFRGKRNRRLRELLVLNIGARMPAPEKSKAASSNYFTVKRFNTR
jgi:hypothetical protein